MTNVWAGCRGTTEIVEEPNLSSKGAITTPDLKGQTKEVVGRGELCRISHLERSGGLWLRDTVCLK